MNVDDVRELYRYNEWSNERLIGVIATLPDERVNRDLGGSFKSVRDVVAHVVSTEWVWLLRWGGTNPQMAPEWIDTSSIEDLTNRVRDLERRREQFLRDLTQQALDTTIDYRFISGTPGSNTLGDLMLHVMNHSTYHRGQLASMLRQLGTPPPSTDLIVFRSES